MSRKKEFGEEVQNGDAPVISDAVLERMGEVITTSEGEVVAPASAILQEEPQPVAVICDDRPRSAVVFDLEEANAWLHHSYRRLHSALDSIRFDAAAPIKAEPEGPDQTAFVLSLAAAGILPGGLLYIVKGDGVPVELPGFERQEDVTDYAVFRKLTA